LEGFVKYLIVNADDFGASRGINRAILELHELGVVTSASLMMTMRAAGDAVKLAKANPALGAGLHVTLTDEDVVPSVDFDDAASSLAAIQAQVDAFSTAFDRLPTHLDTHQNVHRDPRLTPLFKDIARRYELPLREHSAVRYFSNFYGQWDGDFHPEQVSLETLLQMLETELRDGSITELSCHPGYVGEDFASPYHSERELELRTLSDPRLREFLRAGAVKLISFRDVRALTGQAIRA
jgi:chitin disaccharide deacetylase